MNQRVLVVDDNEELAENIAEILSDEGYETSTAFTPEDALARCGEAREKWDIILLDVRMPGMDGVELYQRLRESCAGSRYFLMTAFARDDRLALARAEGIERVLSKPVKLDALLELFSNRLDTVLLVEDDDALARNLVELLADRWRVVRVGSVAEAKEWAQGERFELAVVDFHLPDGDGRLVIDELVNTGTGVVAITALDPEAKDEVETLLKPFSSVQLIAALDRATAA